MCNYKMCKFIYLFLVGTIVIYGVQAQTLTVNTTEGLVQGSTATDGNYFTFYGLRYGGSTSGENRFMAPTPAPQYPGLFVANTNVECIQPSTLSSTGSEDCLTLNIFTRNETAGKPVIVWLEGEGYLSTKMKNSFKKIVLQDIVVVALKHRVSIFGFLCLGVPEAPGNAGLKDVILGLQWIQKNIARFGGDPNNVILLGHGSGAAMVDLITLSPQSKGLVHKAIALSGSALAPWAIAYDPIGYAGIVAKNLGYSGKSQAELAYKLKYQTELNVLISSLKSDFTNNTVLFAPCIENSALNGTFLADAPINILRSGNFSHIPYLAGYTDREGTLRAGEANEWIPKMKANLTQFIQVDLEFDTETNKTKAVNSISNFYFGNSSNIDIEDYLDFHGDTSILVSVIRGAMARAETSKAEVRLFEFAYRGSTNAEWAYNNIPLNGVKHGGILEYLFDINMSEQSINAMTSLVSHFTTFARNGTPDSVIFPGRWLPVTEQSFNYLYFSGAYDQPHEEIARQNPHTQRMTFWNNLYSSHYKTPISISSAPKTSFDITFYTVLFVFIVKLICN
ncbi:bile salt-activated lipase-like [Aphomia sociella]